jgi:hypothetical protein
MYSPVHIAMCGLMIPLSESVISGHLGPFVSPGTSPTAFGGPNDRVPSTGTTRAGPVGLGVLGVGEDITPRAAARLVSERSPAAQR